MLKDKYTIALTAILVVGFALRLVGFEFEYFFNSLSDETYQNSCVLRMLEEKTLFPKALCSPYPALLTFIHIPSIVLGLFILFLKAGLQPEALSQTIALYPLLTLPAIRIFSVIVGTLAIILIYKITKLLFDSRLKGLIAAAFLAVSLMPVQFSHWGRPWNLIIFFTLLVLYSAILIYKSGLRKHYIFSGIAASSALGIHYAGFFSIIFIFFGHFLRKLENLPTNIKNLYLSLVLFLSLGAFWTLLNAQGIFRASSYFQLGTIEKYLSNLFLIFKPFAVSDPVVFLIFAASLLINFKKAFRAQYLLLLSFLAFYITGMVLLNFDTHIRWSLPLVVISIIIAADLMGDLKSKVKSQVVYSALIVGLLLPSLFFSASWDYVSSLPNTRFLAKDWVEKNIPQNSKILFLDTTSVLAVSQEGAKDLNEALAGVRPPNPRYLYLAENGQKVLPGYRVVTWGQFSDNPDYFKDRVFDYYILSYMENSEYQERIAAMPGPEDLELMHEILPFEEKGQSSFEPIQSSSPSYYLKMLRDNIKMTGPSIEIYKKIP